MTIKTMDIGMVPAIVGRVSYTGDLGYEIWVSPAYLNILFDHFLAAGAAYHIKLFGSRALNALRLEKNYGSWEREYRPVYGPVESRLNAFVAYEKPTNFIGKSSALAEREAGGTMRLCSFVIKANDADVIGGEPISYNGRVVGWVTSGGYAHAASQSMAQGYVPKEIVNEDMGWSIELLGENLAAKLQQTPLFDVNASRMRS